MKVKLLVAAAILGLLVFLLGQAVQTEMRVIATYATEVTVHARIVEQHTERGIPSARVHAFDPILRGMDAAWWEDALARDEDPGKLRVEIDERGHARIRYWFTSCSDENCSAHPPLGEELELAVVIVADGFHRFGPMTLVARRTGDEPPTFDLGTIGLAPEVSPPVAIAPEPAPPSPAPVEAPAPKGPVLRIRLLTHDHRAFSSMAHVSAVLGSNGASPWRPFSISENGELLVPGLDEGQRYSVFVAARRGKEIFFARGLQPGAGAIDLEPRPGVRIRGTVTNVPGVYPPPVIARGPGFQVTSGLDDERAYELFVPHELPIRIGASRGWGSKRYTAEAHLTAPVSPQTVDLVLQPK